MKNIKTQVGRSFFSIVAVNKIWRDFQQEITLEIGTELGKTLLIS
jgi:hypothetical protein